MATETLNLNLNEANPPEESPTKTLDPTAATDQGLHKDPADPSAQPPSSTVNGGEEAPQKEVEGSKGRDGTAGAVPLGSVAGNAAPDSDVQKKIRRAERFGMPVKLSEAEKRNSRAERFGTAPTSNGSDASKKSEGSDALKKSEGSDASKKAEEMKRKARAERFGLPVPSEATDDEAKKKARLARFAPPTKVDAAEEDKRKARALRFSEAPSSSPPEAIGKDSIEEPKAAIASKAVGRA